MSNDCNTYLRLTLMHASIEQPLLIERVGKTSSTKQDKTFTSKIDTENSGNDT